MGSKTNDSGGAVVASSLGREDEELPGTELMVDASGVDGARLGDKELEQIEHQVTQLLITEFGLLPDSVQARIF